jgi:lysophospholipase L1-like esterase
MTKTISLFSIIVFIIISSCIKRKDVSPIIENKIVVLGSSTAFGTGPKVIDSAWVYLLIKYEKRLNTKNVVTNLAKGGYTTYHVLPTNIKKTKNRPKPDIKRNISKALTFDPDIIIVNLPSNDASYGYTVEEQMINFSIIDSICKSRNIDLFVSTAQPRNFSQEKRNELFELNKTLNKKFSQNRIIDFWTEIANYNGTIKELYNSGDGVHLNSQGHRILFNRVLQKIGKQ